ncbi:Transcription factor bHLH52, partial [Mucuna pruriens]
MALNAHFNWDTLQIPNSETSTFHEAMPEEVVVPNLRHSFPYSDESLFHSNASFENYFDPTGGFFYPPYDPYISLNQCNIFPTHEDYSLLPCSKRQKCSYEEQEQQQLHSLLQELITTPTPSNFLEEFVVPCDNCCSLQAEELMQQQQLFSEVPQHGTYVDLQHEKQGNERTISLQSIAARERRRKITEKTQELGKLVPGGPKMNTAEMFHAAAKYVKYLQAQVGMLQLMKTLQEDKAAPPENLHALIISPFVQEKLYMEERCFVSKEFVTTLTNHEDVQSRPNILEDVKQLIGTDIEKKAKQE